MEQAKVKGVIARMRAFRKELDRKISISEAKIAARFDKVEHAIEINRQRIEELENGKEQALAG